MNKNFKLQESCLFFLSSIHPSLSHFFPFFLPFRDRVSLHSPGSPGACYVNQAGFETSAMHLPLSPERWYYRRAPFFQSRSRDMESGVLTPVWELTDSEGRCQQA